LSQALANPAYVCFIWFGMTAGISLLATPARFTAPTITREVGLDVGRVVFGALNKAELVALVVLLIVVRVSGRARELWQYCSILVLVLLAQSVWLLPSMLHGTYSILELLKLGVLLYLGFKCLETERT
jgi:hypothetical protein